MKTWCPLYIGNSLISVADTSEVSKHAYEFKLQLPQLPLSEWYIFNIEYKCLHEIRYWNQCSLSTSLSLSLSVFHYISHSLHSLSILFISQHLFLSICTHTLIYIYICRQTNIFYVGTYNVKMYIYIHI